MIRMCFCGIDGSGKTSQVNILRDSLISTNKQVVIIHLFSQDTTALSKFHNRFGIARFISFIRHLPNSLSFLKISLRLINLLLDSWVTFIINRIKYKDKIVIKDRYFYDILVILAVDYPRIANFLMHFAVFIPKPRFVFILDIGPETAMQRKKESSLEKAKMAANLYLLLGKKIKCEPINANLGKGEVAAQIHNLLKGII